MQSSINFQDCMNMRDSLELVCKKSACEADQAHIRWLRHVTVAPFVIQIYSITECNC